MTGLNVQVLTCSSAYGLVFRMQSDLLVAPSQYANNVHGEWRNLAASNVLLSASIYAECCAGEADVTTTSQVIVSVRARARMLCTKPRAHL